MIQPAVGHVKDGFLPPSETFVFHQIEGLRRYRSIVLDRHPRRRPQRFFWDPHFSPAEELGPWAGILERAALRFGGVSPYLERVLRRERVSILHAHFGQLAALFVPVARRHHLPLITSFYGTDAAVFASHPAWRRRFDLLWEHGERFLVVGPAMAERLRERGCPAERIEILPLSVDLDALDFVERSAPSSGRPFHVVTAGRLVPVKGMDVLLRAVAKLRSTHPVQLSVAGDGPERRNLELQARELGILDDVRFLGWVEHREMAALMARAHVFVLASRRDPSSGQTEGTPSVLLEAQAVGLPIVATAHGDIPFIVPESERDRVLVPEGDSEALAEALVRALDRNGEWAELGTAGRAFVEKRHGKERVIERLEHVYDRCLESRSSATNGLATSGVVRRRGAR